MWKLRIELFNQHLPLSTKTIKIDQQQKPVALLGGALPVREKMKIWPTNMANLNTSCLASRSSKPSAFLLIGIKGTVMIKQWPKSHRRWIWVTEFTSPKTHLMPFLQSPSQWFYFPNSSLSIKEFQMGGNKTKTETTTTPIPKLFFIHFFPCFSFSFSHEKNVLCAT